MGPEIESFRFIHMRNQPNVNSSVVDQANHFEWGIRGIGLIAGLFAYYVGEGSILLWIFSLICVTPYIRAISLSSALVVLAACIVLLAKMALQPENIDNLLIDLRFFWGFLPFFLFFSSERLIGRANFGEYENFFKIFLTLAFIATVLEFFSANFFGLQWPNNNAGFFELEKTQDIIMRIYGFGGYPAISTTLVVALTAVLFRTTIFDFIMSAMMISGTGATVLLLKIIFRINLITALGTVILGIPFIIWGVPYLVDNLNFAAFYKLSIDYFSFIYEFKVSQITNVFSTLDSGQILVGQALRISELQTGDFIWLDWFVANGVIGTLLFLVLIGANLCKYNWLPVLLILVGTIHYQVFCSLPGTIIFGWILAYRGSNS